MSKILYLSRKLWTALKSVVVREKNSKRSKRINTQTWLQPICLSCPFKNHDNEIHRMTILRHWLPDYITHKLVFKECLWHIISYSVYSNPVLFMKLTYLHAFFKETLQLTGPKPLHTNAVEPRLEPCSSGPQDEGLVHLMSISLTHVPQKKVFSELYK